MLFTEPAFLFLFLPGLLFLYLCTPHRGRNALLALASLLFYAIGEWRFVPLLLASIVLNYVIAIWVEDLRATPWARWILAAGVVSDLALLLVFKYSGWLVEILNSLLAQYSVNPLPVPKLLLPLGISFFTFHKISYKVDVYRGVARAQRSPVTLGLYILLFPQLIAGPIIRYHDIADQLFARRISLEGFAAGVERFIVGLAKKVILANTVGLVADRLFAVPPANLSCGAAWLGIICYTLQIYYDFSGYSDMAIGLGLMFGFRFLENFDHPYASQSITEFWRRWHISLSRWFRDYLYIPIGGNRLGSGRTYTNLLVVFFLCGLWHGASWEFVAWGLFHGLFLVLERMGLGVFLERRARPVRHAYCVLVVMIGWVFFRAGSLQGAVEYLQAMFTLGRTRVLYDAGLYLDSWVSWALVAGVVAATPLRENLAARLRILEGHHPGPRGQWIGRVARVAGVVGLMSGLVVSLGLIAAGTYNPFIYFRF